MSVLTTSLMGGYGYAGGTTGGTSGGTSGGTTAPPRGDVSTMPYAGTWDEFLAKLTDEQKGALKADYTQDWTLMHKDQPQGEGAPSGVLGPSLQGEGWEYAEPNPVGKYGLNDADLRVLTSYGSGSAVIPIDYVKKYEAEFKELDPNFDITKLTRYDHPLFGETVTWGDLPQKKDEEGLGFGGVLLAIGASFLVGPLAGEIAAATGWGTVASTAAAGGIVGAGTSVIQGGDPLKGALTGAIGGAIGGWGAGLEGGANFVGPVDPSSVVGGTTWQQVGVTAVKGAASTLLSGGDFSSALVSALTSGGGKLATGALTDAGVPGWAAGSIVNIGKGLIHTGTGDTATATSPASYEPVTPKIKNQQLNIGGFIGKAPKSPVLTGG